MLPTDLRILSDLFVIQWYDVLSKDVDLKEVNLRPPSWELGLVPQVCSDGRPSLFRDVSAMTYSTESCSMIYGPRYLEVHIGHWACWCRQLLGEFRWSCPSMLWGLRHKNSSTWAQVSKRWNVMQGIARTSLASIGWPQAEIENKHVDMPKPPRRRVLKCSDQPDRRWPSWWSQSWSNVRAMHAMDDQWQMLTRPEKLGPQS